jgi:hypothetical protein
MGNHGKHACRDHCSSPSTALLQPVISVFVQDDDKRLSLRVQTALSFDQRPGLLVLLALTKHYARAILSKSIACRIEA